MIAEMDGGAEDVDKEKDALEEDAVEKDALEKDTEEAKGDAEKDAEKNVEPTADMCAICSEQTSKYRCPRCDARTCSAACYKEHKRKTSCSGQRDKTGYVAMKAFTDKELRSDLRFLETLGREHNTAQRKRQRLDGAQGAPQPKRRGPREDQDEVAAALPKRVKLLVDAAKRRDTELLVMAAGMTRRQSNTSHYNQRKKEIIWRIVWHVRGQEELADRGITETSSVLDALRRKVPACTPASVKLRVWGGAVVSVDPARTLREALAGHKILEFPEFDVEPASNAQTDADGANHDGDADGAKQDGDADGAKQEGVAANAVKTSGESASTAGAHEKAEPESSANQV